MCSPPMKPHDRLSGSARRRLALAAGALLAAAPGAAIAAPEPTQPAPSPPPPAESPKREPLTFEADGWIGGFVPMATSGLEDLRGGYALGLAAEFWPERHVGIGAEFGTRHATASSATATPPASWDAKDDRMSLDTRWFGPVVRVAWPVGRVRPWVSVGGAVQLSRLALDGTIAGTVFEEAHSSTNLAVHLGAGVDAILLDGFVVSAQAREVWGRASFANLAPAHSGIGGLEVALRVGVILRR